MATSKRSGHGFKKIISKIIVICTLLQLFYLGTVLFEAYGKGINQSWFSQTVNASAQYYYANDSTLINQKDISKGTLYYCNYDLNGNLIKKLVQIIY